MEQIQKTKQPLIRTCLTLQLILDDSSLLVHVIQLVSQHTLLVTFRSCTSKLHSYNRVQTERPSECPE